jgi:hypothetical protein
MPVFVRAVFIASSLAFAAFAVQVTGKVTDGTSGAGIPGVAVHVESLPDSPSQNSYSATSDAEGSFRIEGVAEGAYRVWYTARGFSPVPDPGTILPPFAVGSGSGPVRLDEVRMRRLATLSGRILDASERPVPDAAVWLVSGERWCQRPLSCLPDVRSSRSSGTNEKGEYVFTDLVPGAWLLSATAPPSSSPQTPGTERLGWARTFYPGVVDAQSAEPVVLRGGEQWNPDFKLRAAAVYRVRGRVLDTRGDPVPEVSVAAARSTGPSLTQKTNGDGAFEFPALVEDEWRFSATLEKGGLKLKATQSVDVKGHDLADVELPLAAPFSLRGKVVFLAPEGVSAPNPQMGEFELVSGAVLFSDGFSFFHVDSDDDGNLTVKDLYAGTYQIRQFSDSGAPYYLDSIRLGDQDVLGPLTILSDSQPLTITYRLGGGNVRGNVESCGAAHVVLIPQEAAQSLLGFMRIAECGPNGRFEIPAVRPGEYLGFAIEGTSLGALMRDTELSKKATSVTVREHESTSIEVRVIAR